MSLFFIGMTSCEFGVSFNKQPNHSCTECGADIWGKNSMIKKWLYSKIPQGLLQE